MKFLEQRRNSDRGAAAVEFALSLPILLTVFFVVITMGSALTVRQHVSEAASEATRSAAGSLPGSTDSEIVQAALNSINRSFAITGEQCGNELVCDITIYDCPGIYRCVEVELTYLYRDNPKSLTPGWLIDIMPERIIYSASAEVTENV